MSLNPGKGDAMSRPRREGNRPKPRFGMKQSSDPPLPPSGGTGDPPVSTGDPTGRPSDNRPSDNRPFLDPLQDLFGPESPTKYLGLETDNIPDEIMAILVENGLSDRQFNCTLKEIPRGAHGEPGDYKNQSEYIKGFQNVVPSTEWIARTYGPGSYLQSFSWIDKDASGHRDRQNVCVITTISDKFMDEYRDYQLDKKILAAKMRNDKVHNAILDKKLDSSLLGDVSLLAPPAIDPKEAARQYMNETMEAAKMFGFGPHRGIEWDKILPIALPLIVAFLEKQGNASREMFQLMLSLTSANNAQLLELAKVQNGQGQGSAMFKEMKDMILGAVDLKAAISPERETVADKVFKVVEGVLPQILQIAALNHQQRQQDWRYKVARAAVSASPDFKAVMNDPAELAKMIAKLDDHYGWEQADQVLMVAGLVRPPACGRDPALQYPKGDPRRSMRPPEAQDAVEGNPDREGGDSETAEVVEGN